MARAATTADAFDAVAQPSPGDEEILDLLAGGEAPVNDLVELLGLAQPLVSEHLRVLREVGLVEVRGDGRQRVYRLNAGPLMPIYDWVRPLRAGLVADASTGLTPCWKNWCRKNSCRRKTKAEEDGENDRDE